AMSCATPSPRPTTARSPSAPDGKHADRRAGRRRSRTGLAREGPPRPIHSRDGWTLPGSPPITFGRRPRGAGMGENPVEALSEAEAREELDRLAEAIGRANRAYHAEDAPEISDADYDALKRRNA